MKGYTCNATSPTSTCTYKTRSYKLKVQVIRFLASEPGPQAVVHVFVLGVITKKGIVSGQYRGWQMYSYEVLVMVQALSGEKKTIMISAH